MTTVGIFVHDIGSREIRVRFDVPIPDADTPDSYAISSLTGYVPTVIDVSYYDADMLSVKITLDAALTNGDTYSCQVSGLYSSDGSPVTTTPFDFVSTDEDRPQILGAYLSKRGHIDVICDREVAQTSTIASASLIATGEPPVALVLVPWTSGQSLNAVRFSFSSAPSATSFSVRYYDITDVSGNSCWTGEVPLPIPFEASGYSDLVQAQATLAIVADVSNAPGFATTVLRIFFNCPMASSSILNQSKWSVSQSGAHIAEDTGNSITAANATDTPSFVALANDAKAKLNSHLVSHAHVETDFGDQITTADAVDYSTASSLTNEILNTYVSHYDNISMHLYADHAHLLVSYIDPMDKINDLKSKFNGHVLESYDVDFSTAYSPIGPIMNFASSSNSDDVFDEFTWFADLHVASDATEATFSISYAGLSSEDSGSLATGTIEASPFSNLPEMLSVSRLFRGSTIRMDCDAGVYSDTFSLVDSDNSDTPIKNAVTLSSSLSVLVWAFNNVLHAYKIHISDPSLSPWLGAKHRVLDSVNTVSLSDYVTTMDLDILISKANSFKSKLNAHVSAEAYHYGQDVGVESANATDLSSLIDLVFDLRSTLIRHNSSGFESMHGRIPSVLAFHEFPGAGIVSANVRNLISVSFDGAINGNNLHFESPVLKIWKDNRLNTVDRIVHGRIFGDFIAVDNIPTLVSAVARPGFLPASPSDYLLSDIIEIYLSKPMRNQSLTIGTDIMISGASITMSDAGWINDRTIAVQVISMSTSTYSVGALNICDVAGNPVYFPLIA